MPVYPLLSAPRLACSRAPPRENARHGQGCEGYDTKHDTNFSALDGVTCKPLSTMRERQTGKNSTKIVDLYGHHVLYQGLK